MAWHVPSPAGSRRRAEPGAQGDETPDGDDQSWDKWASHVEWSAPGLGDHECDEREQQDTEGQQVGQRDEGHEARGEKLTPPIRPPLEAEPGRYREHAEG